MSRIADRYGRPGRFGVRALPACALVAGLIAASAGTSVGAENTPVLPDLIADPATGPMVEIYQDESGSRWLLRFNGYIHNAGRGALELRGSKPVSGEMSVVEQRIYRSIAGFDDVANAPSPKVLFEPTDGHDHWHLRNAAAYSLLNSERTQVAPAQKIGFCLIDSTRVDPWANTNKTYSESNISFCGHGDPGANKVTMGISAGWRDYYDRSLPFQWVDISNVQPGNYSLRADMDPDGVIIEANEQNSPAFSDAVVPGYVARDVTADILPLVSTPVTLDAEQFGNAGKWEFRIMEEPQHGSLDKEAKEWFSDTSSVRYIPDSGYAGSDRFMFQARTKDSDFPRTHATAVANLKGASEAAATSVPASAPAPDMAAAEQRRAPDVPGPLPALGGLTLAAPQVHIDHGDLIVRTVAAVSGVIRMVVRDSDGVEWSCQESIPAGTPFTCLLGTGVDGDALSGARVLATLRSGGHLLGSTETGLR